MDGDDAKFPELIQELEIFLQDQRPLGENDRLFRELERFFVHVYGGKSGSTIIHIRLQDSRRSKTAPYSLNSITTLQKSTSSNRYLVKLLQVSFPISRIDRFWMEIGKCNIKATLVRQRDGFKNFRSDDKL
jgi:hypothetical protein